MFLLRASGHRTSGRDCSSAPSIFDLPQVGWPTATTRDWKDGGNPDVDVPLNALLGRVAWLAGWPTPNAGPQNDTDTKWEARRARIKAEKKNGNGFGMTLGMATQLCGPARLTASGELLTGSCAGMSAGGQLSPLMSAWLMGFSEAWDRAAIRAATKMKPKRGR